MKKQLLLATTLFCFVNIANAQPGQLDLSFGKKGIVKNDLGAKIENSSLAKQVLPLSDGSFYVIFESGDVTQITRKKPNGTPDLTYGLNGYSEPVRLKEVHAVLQTDGKVVIAGTFVYVNNDFGIARFNTDGSLDKTFANNGIQHTDFNGYDDAATSIAIQADGKIVVSGNTEITKAYDDEETSTYNIAVARYNTNGNLDNTFSADGIITGSDNFLSTSGNSSWVAITSGGKILVTDFFDNGTDRYLKAVRFNSNGSTDNTFSININLANNNGSYFNIKSSVVQNNGKILIGGVLENSNTSHNFELARFNTNGSPDITFGNNGKQTTDFRGYNDYLNTLAIQSDGKIVAAGSASNGSNNAFAIARYNTNGSPDNTFDQDGKKMNFISSYNVTAVTIAVSNTGKIISAGYNQPASGTNMAIAVYNANGSLDNTFKGTGSLIDYYKQGNTVYNSLVVQADGKIVVAGYTSNGTNNDFAVARYKTDGSLDSSFSGDGIATVNFGANDYGNAIALQADGKIIVAGSADNGTNNNFAIARFNTNGSADNTFDNNGKLTTDFGGNESATVVAVQSNGKIVAAGGQAIARYNSNGSVDVSFNGTGKLVPDRSFNDYAVQSDGKIVAAGEIYDDENNFSLFLISRYNSNGSIDNSFGDNGSQTTNFFPDFDPYEFSYSVNVNSVRIQNDGKIVVGGSASVYGRHGYENTNVALARYNSDGSADNTFSDDGRETIDFGHLSENPSIALRDNDKIVVKAKLFDNIYVDFGYMDGFSNADAGYAFKSLNADGNSDTTFASGGIQYAATYDEIQSIATSGNYLYAAGYSQTAGKLGFLSRYLLKINKAPTVTLTAPANNAKYTAPAAHIKLSAAAADKDGTITKVEFYNGTTLLHTETVFPYGYVWRNVSLGNYTITAKATDNSGLVTTSAPVHISVVPDKAPTVNIINPANGKIYPGPAILQLEAAAKDPDGRITKVAFYTSTTLLRTERKAPYTYNWENVPAGTYTITAVATDNWGAQTTSAPVTVTVASNAMIVSNKPFNNKIGINEAISVKLYPNPATSIVNLYTRGIQQSKPADISIISVSGMVLKKVQSSSSAQTQLDVSSLAKGVYTIKIVSGGEIMYKQFVKL